MVDLVVWNTERPGLGTSLFHRVTVVTGGMRRCRSSRLARCRHSIWGTFHSFHTSVGPTQHGPIGQGMAEEVYGV